MTTPAPSPEKDVQALADALYADADLGPGYMLRDDCEHLARRVLVALGSLRCECCLGRCTCGGRSVIPPAVRHARGCAAGVAPSAPCTCPLPSGVDHG